MSIKKLAGETAIYGVSSILGRVLNFALVPLYTELLLPGTYGIVIELYAVVAFVMVFFTYRIEVAYFRFGTDESLDRKTTFNTALSSLLLSTAFLGLIFVLLAPYYAAFANLQAFQTYIYICIGIICLDTLCELPYAELRLSGQPVRFAAIRIANILTNLGLNLFFLVGCPWILENENLVSLHPFIHSIYNPDIGIGYIFIANFVASCLSFLLLSPLFRQYQFLFDKVLWKKMMRYVIPLVIVGFAYLINEMLDKILIPRFYPDEESGRYAVGVYGANYKIAVLIALFTQAFRYGAEPFFFRNKDKKNAPVLYAIVAKYFLIFGLVGFLVLTLYLDVLKLIIIRQEEYWEGLKIVPIILLANVLAGLYYNFSVWYKLLDKTQWGAYISVGGAIITIALNIWWIPIIGYMGSAWATLICYLTMTVACYYFGKKHYPIPYPIFRMISYLVVTVSIYLFSEFIRGDNLVLNLGFNTILLISYLGFIYGQERQYLKNILAGKY